MKKWLLCIVLIIGSFSCRDEEKVASLESLFDEKTGELLSIGTFGGEQQKQQDRLFVHVDLSPVEKQIDIIAKDSIVELCLAPRTIQLPEDWRDFDYLNFEIENMNEHDICIEFGIKGRWLDGSRRDTILARKAICLNYPLIELPLIASIEKPFSPSCLIIRMVGALLGDRIRLKKISLVYRKAKKLDSIVDKYGQRKYSNWDGKVKTDQDLLRSFDKENDVLLEEIKERDRLGGMKSYGLKATGFFRYDKIGDKWWFVTPDGNLFWSLGVTGVRPKNEGADVTPVKGRAFLYDYLPEIDGGYRTAWEKDSLISFYYLNLLRKYPTIQDWRENVFNRLSKWGINTIGNWSEDSLLLVSKIPFTKSFDTKISPYYYSGGFCDYFNPGWQKAVDSILSQAVLYKKNPLLLGYFVDNEQEWGKGEFSNILKNLPLGTYSRKVWLKQIKDKYKTIENLNRKNETTFTSWKDIEGLTDERQFIKLKDDVKLFEESFADIYFKTVSTSLKKYDPNHLYMGCRFTRQLKPVHIIKTAAKYTDIITVNVYTFIEEEIQNWHKISGKPILIGEHHVPLYSNRQYPPNYKSLPEKERQSYYLNYVERWAKMNFSLGCHWYQFVDQQLTGRVGNGECQTVGLIDVTDQPYKHMIQVINQASLKMYEWHSME